MHTLDESAFLFVNLRYTFPSAILRIVGIFVAGLLAFGGFFYAYIFFCHLVPANVKRLLCMHTPSTLCR